jgi:hypothetical protein
MKRMYWIAWFVALTLTACGGQMSDGTAILPLEEMDGGVEGPNVLENTPVHHRPAYDVQRGLRRRR